MGQEEVGSNPANKKCVSEDLNMQILSGMMVTFSTVNRVFYFLWDLWHKSFTGWREIRGF